MPDGQPDILTSNDLQLLPGDVQQIEDAQQLVHFFARLGYNVDEAASLAPATLGLDADNLRHHVHALQLVATDPDADEINVYLLVVRAVTVTLQQRIARRFRERPESALLVLTTDFSTLDFVLLDRELAPSRSAFQPFRQIVQPRTLTVDRRNPGPIALRVLRRFTYTESDPFYQWEKLRSAFTLAQWSEPHFNNRALFSDYYLKQRLTDPDITPQWAENVLPIGREVARLINDAPRAYSNRPESAIRRGFYEPLFERLGFRWEKKKGGDSAAEEADYFLYGADDGPQTADGDETSARDETSDVRRPLAAVLTYVWNRNLDMPDDKRDEETPDEIPGALVVSVLQQAHAPWVIVTNGKLWRLYAAAADNKATNYYEVDLQEAVNAPAAAVALRYWWLFFRSDAFRPADGDAGFLDHLLQASDDYARALRERLKERVFTEIFPHFAQGFMRSGGVTAATGGRGLETSATDPGHVFSATMTFLYRLMFILYAESLDLLPVHEERGYRPQSLYRLKARIAGVAGLIDDEAPQKIRAHFSATSTALYEQLQALFQAIGEGRPDWNLPVYNGGLFSADTPEGRFLAQNAIPDRYLALGLDRLARDVDEKTQALAMIDYKDLGVRHLGSIYEGLLEFKLRVAAEELAVVKQKGREVYVPVAALSKARTYGTVPKGDVYLENDKRERKATGSYYTPDYIVKYIVQHTVGPVLDRKFEELAPRLREAQRRYRQHAQRVHARGDDQSPELWWNDDREARRLADDCLDIRCLDPAMGSGHFLVEVVDFVSNRLLDFLNAWSENPVWAMLERMRAEILADVESQGVTVDAGKLTRVALLKRAVLKRCIYGVDLNAMAVELAKVSLWLDAFTLGAPLSFLDHHLKQGNSLIGARVKEVQEALEGKANKAVQMSLFGTSKFAGVMLATDLMRQVSTLSDNTASQVQESRQAYRDARDHLAPFKRILDVYTSRWFGNAPSKAGFDFTIEFLQRDDTQKWLEDPTTPLPEEDYMDTAAVAQRALQAAEEKHFFHWELEFPEVFFAPSAPGAQDVTLLEDGGFDAVVGNPPYGTPVGKIANYTQLMFVSGDLDYYTVFIEHGLNLIKKSAMLGLIVPNTWTQIFSANHFRKHLLEKYSVKHIVHSTEYIFADAAVDTEILIVEGVKPFENRMEIHVWSGNGARSFFMDQQDWIRKDGDIISVLLDETAAVIAAKMEKRSRLLGELFTVKNGVKPFEVGKGSPPQTRMITRDKPFVSDRKVDDSFRPLIRGSLIDRYTNLWNGDYWISYGEWLAAPRDPSIFFNFKHKLILRQTGYDLVAVKIDDSFIARDNLHIILPDESKLSLDYLLGLLNSNLMNYYYHMLNPEMGESFAQVKLGHVERLPIAEIEFVDDQHQTEHLEDLLVEDHDINAAIASSVEDAISANRFDALHDMLCQLAREMLESNNRRVSECNRFLDWLSSHLQILPRNDKTGIEALSGYTIIQNYLGDYQKGEPELPWSEMAYRLHANRSRFEANWERVKGQVQAEYEKSLATLRPIKQQLAETDALIDKIVYKLYGLTDEEIALIEQPQYEQALQEAKEAVVSDKKLQKDSDAAAEALAQNVLPAARRFQQRVDHDEHRARLEQDLPGWRLLPGDVPTFLLTGEYNINTLPEHLDFSTSVVSYAKAVETVIYQKLFVAFREAIRTADGGRQTATSGTINNRFLKEFVEGTREHLTLGSMQRILPSSKETALRAFALRVFPVGEARLFGPEGVAARLNDEEIRNLRNKAAHDEVLTREDARKARAWAVGVLGRL